MNDDLIYDITVRFPRDRIVFRGHLNEYQIFNSETQKFTHTVQEEIINNLIEKGFVEKKIHGGLELTTKLFEYSDSLPPGPTKKIESHKEPGKFYDVNIPKERWFPN